jgi:hypothetical protein
MVEEFAFDNTEERRKTRQNGNGVGWIEVIVGSMFSGKSEELIRRLRRAQIARQKVQVFKPKIDDRYSIEQIASHSGMTHVSKPVMTAAELMAQIEPDTQVVGIDEGQFFDMEIIEAARSSRCLSSCRWPNSSRKRTPSASDAATPRTTRKELRIRPRASKSARRINTKRAAASASSRIRTRRRSSDFGFRILNFGLPRP